MTHVIDELLITHGFEGEELEGIRHRSVLYVGILTTGLIAIASLSLALTAWI